ncbi:hypothetical protein XELAEV_18035605mg [Xenopus laevis]|uniref:Uncharacterized protein n=1 Tax=Xenopus laevis TaxID=8355 RepID=A0A974CG20_XENLA|nr:hypothetical protein XELAEV_18035605mg [Xenopus laevis]
MPNPIHEELSVIDPQWENLDPKPDIHALYKELNVKFFRGKLPEPDLKWSNRISEPRRRINKLTGANIMAYPDFKDEYDLLKCHWWECNGPCGELVTRIMNRPPATQKEMWRRIYQNFRI